MRRIVGLVALAILLVVGRASAQEVFAGTSANVTGNGAAQWQGWNPMEDPGVTIWLRSDLGIAIATGVSTWTDQSGNGNSPTQATGGKQPAYTAASGSSPAKLTFTSASSQELTSSTNAISKTVWTIAAVHQFNSACQTAGCYSVSFGTATNGNAFKVNSAAQRDVTARGVADRNDGSATTAIESWIATNDGTTTKLWVGNVSQSLTNSTTNAASSGAGVFLGCDVTNATFLSGALYEVVAWGRALDAGEIWRLSAYEGSLFGSAVH
jgi:hypothetical protein